MLTLLFHVMFATSFLVAPASAAPAAALPLPEAAVADDGEEDDDDAAGFSEVSAALGMTTEQKDRVQQLIFASRSARIDQKAKAAKAKLELKQSLTAASLDEKAVNKSLESFIAAEAELQRSKIRLLVDMRKQLTAEQWDKLVEMKEERKRERRSERRSSRRGDDE